jgi:hypothetical protein
MSRTLRTASLLAALAASLAGCVVYQPPPAAFPAYPAGGYYAYPVYPYPAYPAFASVSLGFGFGGGFHRHWR